MPSLAELDLKPHELACLEQVARLLKADWQAEEVVLFGSRARGTAESDADWDLFVLLPHKPTSAVRSDIRDMVLPLEVENDVWIDLLIVSREEWEEGVYQVLGIKKDVLRDGVRL